jgi:hypothetical protein
VEEGIKLRLDSATIHHLPMEEQIVSDQILIPHLAIMCPVVKNSQNIKHFCKVDSDYNLELDVIDNIAFMITKGKLSNLKNTW